MTNLKKLNRVLMWGVFLCSVSINATDNRDESERNARTETASLSTAKLAVPSEIASHWLDIIEQSFLEAKKRFSTKDKQEHLKKIKEMLDCQQKEVTKFSKLIESNSMDKLLDELLTYRIAQIKLRNNVVEKAKKTEHPDYYVELAPRSQARKLVYYNFFDDYSETSYENNMIKSVCLHMLIKAVFEQIENPKKLKQRTKHKICVQPSLFNYLNGEGDVPWALDFTLSPVSPVNQYFAIPDYSLDLL